MEALFPWNDFFFSLQSVTQSLIYRGVDYKLSVQWISWSREHSYWTEILVQWTLWFWQFIYWRKELVSGSVFFLAIVSVQGGYRLEKGGWGKSSANMFPRLVLRVCRIWFPSLFDYSSIAVWILFPNPFKSYITLFFWNQWVCDSGWCLAAVVGGASDFEFLVFKGKSHVEVLIIGFGVTGPVNSELTDMRVSKKSFSRSNKEVSLYNKRIWVHVINGKWLVYFRSNEADND